MTILPAQLIRLYKPIEPFCERTEYLETTYGLGPASYDIRIDQELNLRPGEFTLASTVEHFVMPNILMAVVHDKSSWARRGLAVQNTLIDPGWNGYLTIELTNHSNDYLWIQRGVGIAQIVFHLLKEPTELPYEGKYQNQEAGPQKAR